MDKAVDVAGRLTETGVVSILLFFLIMIVVGVSFTCIFLARKLFADEKGLLPQLFFLHKQFLEKLEQSIKAIVAAIQDNTETSRKIDSTMKKLLVSTQFANAGMQHFKRVWSHHVQVLRVNANRAGFLDEELERHLVAMESYLDNMPELEQMEVADKFIGK